MRFLPRSRRGTWLLAVAVWLAGCAVLWWLLPYRPKAMWATEGSEPDVVIGFIPGTPELLTCAPWSGTIDGPPGPMLGPLVVRDANTGRVRELCGDGERLTLVDPGVDGRHILIGRVVKGRTRLFLHDAASGKMVAELPRRAAELGNENDEPPDANEQFAAFRPDGKQVVYADQVEGKHWLRVWDVEERREVEALEDARQPAAWSPDGRMLAMLKSAGDARWSVHLHDFVAYQTRGLGAALPWAHRPVQLSFSPDCKRVVAASERQSGLSERDQVRCWDCASGTEKFRLSASTVTFLPGLPWFATYDIEDGLGAQNVRRCDFENGTLGGHILLSRVGPQVWHTLSPNGKFVFGVAESENVLMEMICQHVLGKSPGEFRRLLPQLWDAESGQHRYSLQTVIGGAFSIWPQYRWAPDGTILAISGKEALVEIWDIPPRKSRAWFASGASLLALPFAGVARWRIRRVQRAQSLLV